jgi:hypothetical protein
LCDFLLKNRGVIPVSVFQMNSFVETKSNCDFACHLHCVNLDRLATPLQIRQIVESAV